MIVEFLFTTIAAVVLVPGVKVCVRVTLKVNLPVPSRLFRAVIEIVSVILLLSTVSPFKYNLQVKDAVFANVIVPL